MLRRLRKVAAKRDELIAKEKAKADADRALVGPGGEGADGSRLERRRRRTEEAAE
jgi:DNA-directed RNA polymerase subunit beta'